MEQLDKQRRLHDALSECETKPQVCMCVCVHACEFAGLMVAETFPVSSPPPPPPPPDPCRNI